MHSLNTTGNLRDVAGEFLAKGQRSRVLQMGSANLDDVVEALLLLLERVVELLQSRDQGSVDLNNGSDVHGGGEAAIS